MEDQITNSSKGVGVTLFVICYHADMFGKITRELTARGGELSRSLRFYMKGKGQVEG